MLFLFLSWHFSELILDLGQTLYAADPERAMLFFFFAILVFFPGIFAMLTLHAADPEHAILFFF